MKPFGRPPGPRVASAYLRRSSSATLNWRNLTPASSINGGCRADDDRRTDAFRRIELFPLAKRCTGVRTGMKMTGIGSFIRRFKNPLQAELVLMNHFAAKQRTFRG